MSFHDFGWLLCGALIGWATKIPIFLHYYREWESERAGIRAWMKEQDEKTSTK